MGEQQSIKQIRTTYSFNLKDMGTNIVPGSIKFCVYDYDCKDYYTDDGLGHIYNTSCGITGDVVTQDGHIIKTNLKDFNDKALTEDKADGCVDYETGIVTLFNGPVIIWDNTL